MLASFWVFVSVVWVRSFIWDSVIVTLPQLVELTWPLTSRWPVTFNILFTKLSITSPNLKTILSPNVKFWVTLKLPVLL